MLLDFIAFIELIGPKSPQKSQRPIRGTPEPDAEPTNTFVQQNPRLLNRDEAVPVLRALLSSLLTFGINDTVDKLCADQLRIPPGQCSAGGQFR
jgi:hypothetical protein